MKCPNCGERMSAWSLGPPDLVISDEEADEILRRRQEENEHDALQNHLETAPRLRKRAKEKTR